MKRALWRGETFQFRGLALAQLLQLALGHLLTSLVDKCVRVYVRNGRLEFCFAAPFKKHFINGPLAVAYEVSLVNQMAPKGDVVDTDTDLQQPASQRGIQFRFGVLPRGIEGLGDASKQDVAIALFLRQVVRHAAQAESRQTFLELFCGD